MDVFELRLAPTTPVLASFTDCLSALKVCNSRESLVANRDMDFEKGGSRLGELDERGGDAGNWVEPFDVQG